MYVAGPLDNMERIKYNDIEVFIPDYSKTVPTGKWEKLEPDKNYYVAGTNYALFKGGDGASFFKGDTTLAKTVYEDHSPDTGYDYKVLARYVENFKKVNDYPEIATSNSPLPFSQETFMINYENVTAGGGRVQIIEQN